jgi:hypothetical protein
MRDAQARESIDKLYASLEANQRAIKDLYEHINEHRKRNYALEDYFKITYVGKSAHYEKLGIWDYK